MFKLSAVFYCALLASTGPAVAQLIEFSDDFTSVATYNAVSLQAPCYGGPPTKYTLIEGVQFSSIFNERAVSGDGILRITNRELANDTSNPNKLSLSNRRYEYAVVGWLGLGLGCPGEPSFKNVDTAHHFDDDDLCIYGGVIFNPWQFKSLEIGGDAFGPDDAPGIAGVDDDGNGSTDGGIGNPGVDDDEDGTTDEPLEVPDLGESPATAEALTENGYPNADGTGLWAGFDGAPGVAGVDDDMNGTTDEIGETGWPGTDDGDDMAGVVVVEVWMRLTLSSDFLNNGIFLHVHPAGASPVDIGETRFELSFWNAIDLENADEIGGSAVFYRAYTAYNWVFSASGTCYGAQLWTEGRMANPLETLGPLMNTLHNLPSNHVVALGAGVTRLPADDASGAPLKNVFTRRMSVRGNTNFSDTFWAVEGDQQGWSIGSERRGHPSPSSDLDNDRDVDGVDFNVFSVCFNGASNPPAPGCANDDADLDQDGDGDGTDFLTFSNCFNGSLNRPLAPCFPPLINSVADGGLGLFEDPCLTGEASGSGGSAGMLAGSAIQSDPFIFDGMSPIQNTLYLYTPACTGDATLALCDATGQGRSLDGIWFAFIDFTAEETMAVPATACGQGASQTVPVVSGQTVYLLVYPESGAEALNGFTLDVTCGP